MRKPEEIITDAEIAIVHAYANFGSMTPREVVNDGVRKYAIGYSGGHTQQCILREHGLITKPKGYSADLTKKGKEYARSIGDEAQAEIARLQAEVERLTKERDRGKVVEAQLRARMDRDYYTAHNDAIDAAASLCDLLSRATIDDGPLRRSAERCRDAVLALKR